VAPSESGTKRLKRTQDRAVVNYRQLVVNGGQVMAATEEVPRTFAQTTTGADQDEWKKVLASELESLTSNKTWKLVPRPTHQHPITWRVVRDSTLRLQWPN
jgi:hypothetical protein